MKVLIDPPEGWKYGFPKEWDGEDMELQDWLVNNGYPDALIDRDTLAYCRFIEKPETDNDQ